MSQLNWFSRLSIAVCMYATALNAAAELDLRSIESDTWGELHARHLASRAGFGANTEEIARLVRLSPKKAVASFYPAGRTKLESFPHSGIFDEGLDPFPPSRPATTALAKRQGHALGVQVKPAGNRPLQGVVNKFFYWLRASRLETDRVTYWWAQQMLNSPAPLQ